MAYIDGRNMAEKEIGMFKRRQKDDIIVRKTCELTNDSLTLFNEIFFCAKMVLRLTHEKVFGGQAFKPAEPYIYALRSRFAYIR